MGVSEWRIDAILPIRSQIFTWCTSNSSCSVNILIQPVTLSLSNLLTVPVNEPFLFPLKRQSRVYRDLFTWPLTKVGGKHTIQTHGINSLHSPLLLPPHEVMNVGPHAAGECSVKYMNNNTQNLTLSRFTRVGADSSKSQWSYL